MLVKCFCRSFTEILQLVRCWLGKEKRVKWLTLEWPGMSSKRTFMKERQRYGKTSNWTGIKWLKNALNLIDFISPYNIFPSVSEFSFNYVPSTSFTAVILWPHWCTVAADTKFWGFFNYSPLSKNHQIWLKNVCFTRPMFRCIPIRVVFQSSGLHMKRWCLTLIPPTVTCE